MAAMARLLETRSLSQTTTEEAGLQKYAAQYIQRELFEADEENLLDEKDMHVFGLKPMSDPLHLVCCNACKKPVKISQYAAHAELCRLLKLTEETLSDVDGSVRHKKPQKERKKLIVASANQAATHMDPEKFESVDALNTSTSGSLLDDEVGMNSPCFVGTKGTAIYSNTACAMDNSGVTPRNPDSLAGVRPPPMKRSKPIAVDCLPLPDQETAHGVAKLTHTSRLEEATSCESPEGLIRCTSYNHVVGYQKPGVVCKHCLPPEDAPFPLATKIYYSQRNHRFKSAFSHLFYTALPNELGSNLVHMKGVQGGIMPSHGSSQEDFSQEPKDAQSGKVMYFCLYLGRMVSLPWLLFHGCFMVFF